jgi:hypothetical protein
MKLLTHDLDRVSGGSAAYDAGHAVGAFIHDCVDVFTKMGSMYTPTL